MWQEPEIRADEHNRRTNRVVDNGLERSLREERPYEILIDGLRVVFGGVTSDRQFYNGIRGPVVSFTDLFNSASDTYTALQNAATAHNTFVKHHSSACASEHGKWWVSKVPQDLAQVGRLQSRLSQASAAQKKKAVYRDLVKTAHDLKHWTQTAITPRLGTCKVMAAQSSKVDLDLSNVCNDLNCGTY